MLDGCCHQLLRLQKLGRHFGLLVIAEGVKTQNKEKDPHIADYLLRQIKEYSQILCHEKHEDFCLLKDIDMRTTVLGHLQRSHPPVAWDRLLSTAFGIKAVELIQAENYDHLVVWQKGQVSSEPLSTVIATIKERHQQKICTSPVEKYDCMVKTARSLGIYLGDG